MENQSGSFIIARFKLILGFFRRSYLLVAFFSRNFSRNFLAGLALMPSGTSEEYGLCSRSSGVCGGVLGSTAVGKTRRTSG